MILELEPHSTLGYSCFTGRAAKETDGFLHMEDITPFPTTDQIKLLILLFTNSSYLNKVQSALSEHNAHNLLDALNISSHFTADAIRNLRQSGYTVEDVNNALENLNEVVELLTSGYKTRMSIRKTLINSIVPVQ